MPVAARQYVDKYGLRWDSALSDLEIEMACIKRGGRWKKYPKDTETVGAGLEVHYENMRKILWPELDDHRWHRLCRDTQIQSRITVLMGPGSSGKTHAAAWFRLCQYYVFAEACCLLISSTDLRGLQLRVWGEIKMLHTRAKERFPDLPGHLVESKYAISTDNIIEDDVRDLRKGIIGVPCIQGGRYVGLGKYSGIKQKLVLLIADEAQFMGASFLSSFANLDKNVHFESTICGNPNDILDPLGLAAEPLEGWGSHMQPEKTSAWPTRFMSGMCVNLVGTDSPNFDFPPDEPTHFPYLISREKIENTLSFFPKDSLEYYSQCIGVMKIGSLSRRVVTRDLAIKFEARDPVVWAGTPRTSIFALDAAYGGDRCVGGKIEFGKGIFADGTRTVILVHQPQIVPIKVITGSTPEDEIALWIKAFCEENEIPPENVFHDSTGRGGLGTAIARVYSAQCNPVEFGGKATPRPVSLDLFIYDPKERKKRLKRCDEHYDRFVTELWWSIRLAIESRQLRGLPEDVLEELCMRQWDKIKENKIAIETKKEMKERVRRSPDLGDWLAIAIEGARRRGFQVLKLGGDVEVIGGDLGILGDLQKRAKDTVQAHALKAA